MKLTEAFLKVRLIVLPRAGERCHAQLSGDEAKMLDELAPMFASRNEALRRGLRLLYAAKQASEQQENRS